MHATCVTPPHRVRAAHHRSAISVNDLLNHSIDEEWPANTTSNSTITTSTTATAQSVMENTVSTGPTIEQNTLPDAATVSSSALPMMMPSACAAKTPKQNKQPLTATRTNENEIAVRSSSSSSLSSNERMKAQGHFAVARHHLGVRGVVAKVCRGPWRVDEDRLLTHLVRHYGACSWTTIASHLPHRSGKQARERWINQLDPLLKKKNWTAEEDRIILRAHARLGNKWSAIAGLLPGRTDNSVKNRFNSTLKRTMKSTQYSHLRADVANNQDMERPHLKFQNLIANDTYYEIQDEKEKEEMNINQIINKLHRHHHMDTTFRHRVSSCRNKFLYTKTSDYDYNVPSPDSELMFGSHSSHPMTQQPIATINHGAVQEHDYGSQITEPNLISCAKTGQTQKQKQTLPQSIEKHITTVRSATRPHSFNLTGSTAAPGTFNGGIHCAWPVRGMQVANVQQFDIDSKSMFQGDSEVGHMRHVQEVHNVGTQVLTPHYLITQSKENLVRIPDDRPHHSCARPTISFVTDPC